MCACTIDVYEELLCPEATRATSVLTKAGV
jgi:hypothetical protein